MKIPASFLFLSMVSNIFSVPIPPVLTPVILQSKMAYPTGIHGGRSGILTEPGRTWALMADCGMGGGCDEKAGGFYLHSSLYEPVAKNDAKYCNLKS